MNWILYIFFPLSLKSIPISQLFFVFLIIIINTLIFAHIDQSIHFNKKIIILFINLILLGKLQQFYLNFKKLNIFLQIPLFYHIIKYSF